MHAERFARYWMNTCADANRMNVNIGNKRYYWLESDEPPQLEKHFFHAPFSSLNDGIVPKDITDIIFSCVPDENSDALERGIEEEAEPDEELRARGCDVFVCPVYLSAASEHGKRKSENDKTISRMTPVWIPALLKQDGTLFPAPDEGSPWIPREYLEPVGLEGRHTVIGEISDLDEYIAKNPAGFETWQDIFRYATGMVEHVINAGKRNDQQEKIATFTVEGYKEMLYGGSDERTGIILVLDKKSKPGSKATANIENLYENMLLTKRFPPLFRDLVSYEIPPLHQSANGADRNNASSRHVGQMGGKYPLVASQREALHHVLLMEDREDGLLAVNGPPGTGKTTLIQSIIASLWVKAVIDDKEPPLIFGTSANNRAVKNIIECFEKIEPPDEETDGISLLNGRWLSGLKSYGAFCAPRKSPVEKEKTSSAGDDALDEERYQSLFLRNDPRTGLFDGLFKEERLSVLETEYLENADRYVSRKDASSKRGLNQWSSAYRRTLTVSDVTQSLREEIVETYKAQQKILDLTYKLNRIDRQIREVLVASGVEDIEAFSEKLAMVSKIEEAKGRFLLHDSTKPLWMVLGGWLGIIRKQVARRNESFFLQEKETFDMTTRIPLTAYADSKTIEAGYDAVLEEIGCTRIKRARDRIGQLEEDQLSYTYDRDVALDSFGITEKKADPDAVDTIFDRMSRYRLFLLATHYWEGKWLIEASGLLEDKRRSGRDDVFPGRDQGGLRQWRNYAKLTPCFVATAFMLPKYLTAWKAPLYEGIDYLIIDEAGQVPPEVVAGCFALAKKAIVIGDTQQIEPVWRVTSSVDKGNITKHKLHDDLPETIKEGDTPAADRGLASYGGNILKAVQGRTRYSSTGEEARRGVLLREHFRCVPEIIEYCNELAYQGQLIPSRKGIDGYILPHLGYAHVRGTCERKGGGSRCNEEEAECIVEWITDNIERLKEYYIQRDGKDINETDLVAVLTPFMGQATVIKNALRRAGKGHLTAGTTHSLQGAERRVVIFSPVYDDGPTKGYFFDRGGVHMLNVAVSRAKDSFLVFGDMNLFRTSPPGSPSRLLGRYLFKNSDNEITNIHIPERRTREKPIDVLYTVEKHVEALRQSIQEAKERVIIYSPWLSVHAVKNDSLDIVIREKTKQNRGVPAVTVTIYTDKDKNRETKEKETSCEAGKKLLLEAGANVVEVDKIHQKIIIVDNTKYIVGSFNWLSSSREKNPNKPYYQENRTMVYSGFGTKRMIEEELKYIGTWVEGP